MARSGSRFELWHLCEVALASEPGAEGVVTLRRDLEGVVRRADAAAAGTGPGDPAARVGFRIDAGLARVYLGDHRGAATDLAAASAGARRIGAGWERGYAAYALGALAGRRAEPVRAVRRLREACSAFGRCGDDRSRAHALTRLGAATSASGDRAEAHAHRLAALDLFRRAGDRFGMLAAMGAPGGVGPPIRSDSGPGVLGALSGRECEVAALVGAGLTNPQIARRLGIAARTVDTHVQRILAKLGCASRVQVAVLVAAGHRPDPVP